MIRIKYEQQPRNLFAHVLATSLSHLCSSAALPMVQIRVE